MNSDRSQLIFLLALFLLALALLAAVIAPFSGAFFSAMVVASALAPWQRRLSSRLGGREQVSALVLTVALLLCIAAPFAVTGFLAVGELADLGDSTVALLEKEGVDGLVERVPEGIRPWVRSLAEQAEDKLPLDALEEGGDPDDEVSEETISRLSRLLPWAKRAVAALQDISLGLVNLLLQAGVTAVAIFFLLSQGHVLSSYLIGLAPLPRERTEELLERLRGVNVALVSSTLLAALLQATVAGVGYLIAGVGCTALVTLITFVCALVPVIGAASVTLVCSLILLGTGETGTGVFLLAWTVLVSLTDNVAKPYLAGSNARMPTSLLFFAMICGVAVFGPLGIIAGPLSVAFFRVVAEALQDHDALGASS